MTEITIIPEGFEEISNSLSALTADVERMTNLAGQGSLFSKSQADSANSFDEIIALTNSCAGTLAQAVSATNGYFKYICKSLVEADQKIASTYKPR